jgi:hypothetical protein
VSSNRTAPSISTGWAEKAQISVFNPHTFRANAEAWVARFVEIVSRPPCALARGMPDRLAYCSSVPSAVLREKTSPKKAEHRVSKKLSTAKIILIGAEP